MLVALDITELQDGRNAYRLRRSFRDGTTLVILDPLTLLQRLAALVPRPRHHLVRYYGCLAPASPLRPEVVPKLPEIVPASDDDVPAKTFPSPSSYIAWAILLRRVFNADPLACPRCSSPMRALTAITDRPGIRAILNALDLPTEPPTRYSARPPPQLAFDDLIFE